MEKTYLFKVNVKDDNYDACKTGNINISGRQNLAKWALTCYGGSSHERLLSESSRMYMLVHYLFLHVLLLHRRSGHHIKQIFQSYVSKLRHNAINALYNLTKKIYNKNCIY
jgi:hypothetical protein